MFKHSFEQDGKFDLSLGINMLQTSKVMVVSYVHVLPDWKAISLNIIQVSLKAN